MNQIYEFRPSLKVWILGALIVGILSFPGMAIYKLIACYPTTCESYLPFTNANSSLKEIVFLYLLFFAIIMIFSLSLYLSPPYLKNSGYKRKIIDKPFGLQQLSKKQNLFLFFVTISLLLGSLLLFIKLAKTF